MKPYGLVPRAPRLCDVFDIPSTISKTAERMRAVRDAMADQMDDEAEFEYEDECPGCWKCGNPCDIE